MREKISLIIDLCIFAVGMPIVGFAYFVIDPLIAYYDGVKRRRKERMMRKSLMIILVSFLIGCSSITYVKAAEPEVNKELGVFCEENVVLLQGLLSDVININRNLHSMIHGDTKDFVPILFAQFKMENLSIMMWSTMVEMYRTANDKEIFNITFSMLDQYIELLRYDILKARMFKGMIANSNRWTLKTKEQVALSAAVVSLQAGYELLTYIKEGLRGFKQEGLK